MRGLGLLVGLRMMRAGAIIARRGRSSLVSAPWLKDNLGDPKLRVLDVTQVLDRSTNTVAPAVDTYMTSHVPGARFVDVAGRLSTPDPKLHNLGAFLRQTFDLSRRWRAGGDAIDAFVHTAPSPEQFAAELSRQGVDDESHVVLYSSSKVMWATRVWYLMTSFGFEGEVSVLDGGLKAWTRAGGGTESGVEPQPTPTTLPIRPARRTAFVDKEACLRSIDAEGLIVDTLKPASFDGSKASRYGRRGHIRTAVNVPYTSLLDEAGCFLPEAELRRAFAGVAENEPVLAY